MRTRTDDPLVTVSCGHRVPRAPVPRDDGSYGFRYWCGECATFRMAGKKATGIAAFDFLFELRDTCASLGIVVDDPGTDRGRSTVRALGASIRA